MAKKYVTTKEQDGVKIDKIESQQSHAAIDNGVSTKLAIEGGIPAISESIRNGVPTWPIVSDETAENLKKAYLSGSWSFSGKNEQEFCRQFATYHDAKHCVFMVNGTVTLECALAALGIKAGDEVIVPAMTWVATAMAAVYMGAVPVFVDIEPKTLCMDPLKLEKAITKRTKAIIPVHLYGSMADMDAIMAIADRHGIPVIEDCAHAHGGMWGGRGVGSIGKVGSFSFQQSKNLSSGEGGACLTNDKELAEKLFRLKHIGYEPASSQGKAQSGPEEGLMCHNYRATEFQAVVLLDGLKKLRAQTELRDDNAKYLNSLIEGYPIKLQARGRKASLQSYYNMVFLADMTVFNSAPLSRLIEVLNAEGLPVGPTYPPVYLHPLWNVPQSAYRIADDHCEVCEHVWRNSGIAMFHTWLLGNKQTMDSTAAAIQKVVKNKGHIS